MDGRIAKGNGIGVMAKHAFDLYYRSAESHEGVQAFVAKRPPEFSKFSIGTRGKSALDRVFDSSISISILFT